MYIAGLELGLTQSQGVEGLVAFTTIVEALAATRLIRKRMKASEAEAGSVKPLPPTFVAKFITPIHIIALLGVPAVYVVATGLNRFEQPQWLLRLSFPAVWDETLGAGGKALVRTAACIASAGSYALFRSSFLHLGSQAHYLGVREKAKIVSDGPYAYVRHPVYSAFLLQGLLLSPMLWSFAPLATLAVATAALVVKIPVEERLIEDDVTIGPEYLSYKEKVRARLIPCIW